MISQQIPLFDCCADIILLLSSHFSSESAQFHVSSEDRMFLLVGIVSQLKSNIVSYLPPAANIRAAGFFFKVDLCVARVKDCCAAQPF